MRPARYVNNTNQVQKQLKKGSQSKGTLLCASETPLELELARVNYTLLIVQHALQNLFKNKRLNSGQTSAFKDCFLNLSCSCLHCAFSQGKA